jgi:hypothetical protein
VFGLLVSGVVGLGFDLRLFHRSTDTEGHQTNGTISVDQDIIRQDEEKAKERGQEVGQKMTARIGAGTEKRNSEGPPPEAALASIAGGGSTLKYSKSRELPCVSFVSSFC